MGSTQILTFVLIRSLTVEIRFRYFRNISYHKNRPVLLDGQSKIVKLFPLKNVLEYS